VTPDPLAYNLGLGHTATFYPIGYPVRVLTNSYDAIRAAEASWGAFTQQFHTDPLEIAVTISGDETAPPCEPVWRARDHLLMVVSDAANFAAADLDRGRASCFVTARAAARQEWFRFHFLDGLCYTMLTHLYVTSIHASSVARNGRGILLCGDSGMGKSSLAFGCMRSGWTFISDDAVFLVRGNGGRTCLGRPHHIRLRPAAEELFPEVRGVPAITSPNGKATVEVSTHGANTATHCEVAFVVLLDRRPDTTPQLEPVSPEYALPELLRALPQFRPDVRREHEQSLRRLLQAPGHRLTYSHLDDAISMLERLTEGP
jgi:hypothetical protein